jgi:cytidylate kinase
MTGVNVIAIDGPAGAGKSTIAKRVAEKLSYAYLDTGAMYRAATWWAIRRNVPWSDRNSLIDTVTCMPFSMSYTDDRLVVRVDGHDVSQDIRTPEVTNAIRNLDGIPEIRDYMVKQQRKLGLDTPTVADGRDMGTVVFPDAFCKIYLDASVDTRLDRRAKEMESKGLTVDREILGQEIIARDANDMNRKVGPLKQASDAIYLDSSDLTIQETSDKIIEIARLKNE